ncbi:MAG: hypothetical protein H7Y11_15165 [Armatimonadetes bacterium]|nr:hypothetical protein [Anaerolineae bacterium]
MPDPDATEAQQDQLNGAQPHKAPHFTEQERNAMRAYLQRCEVRLSTLHRIATAFVSGAGLLLLIPVFFRDVVDHILLFFLRNLGNMYPMFETPNRIALTAALYGLLLYPLLLSLGIPLYGVYLLLKDMVHFYFTIYMPGFSETLMNPTFSLNAVAFSPDESPTVKAEVLRYQYKTSNMNFMLAFSQGKRHEYFDNLIDATQGDILPYTRRLEHLKQEGWLPDDYEEREVNRFNAAFGIARSLDRALVQEVALTEMALVRSVIYLRRLVLRYIKTMVMFLWTMTIAFLMVPFLQVEGAPTFVVLAAGYLVWSMGVMPLIRRPFRWIFRHRLGDIRPEHVDVQLVQMQHHLAPWCYAAVVSSMGALVLALVTLS